jgi:hypothetical protein
VVVSTQYRSVIPIISHLVITGTPLPPLPQIDYHPP